MWNARNELIRVLEGGAEIAEYRYDALGRRVLRVEGGTRVGYLYDGLNTVQEMADGTTNPVFAGLGIDQRFARGVEGERAYFLTDHLGSTRALTDGAGRVVAQYDHAPYGGAGSDGDGGDNPYRFTGRELDGNGLYYYRARYYHAGMGRFISEDPIGLSGGNNMYVYVDGNPISKIDPYGLEGVGSFNNGGNKQIWERGAEVPIVSNFANTADTLRREANDMVRRNFIGADKFHHCLAMCQISSRGPIDASFAATLGVGRELYQQHLKGDPAEECAADNRANGQGIAAGLRGQSCVSSCSSLAPPGFSYP